MTAAASPRGLGRQGRILLALLIAALIAFIAANRRPAPDLTEPGVVEPSPPPLLVAELDLATLRATELGRGLFGPDRNVAGLGNLQELCGGDPLAGVDRLSIWVPADDAQGFGVIGRGTLDRELVLRCASTVVGGRGDRLRRAERGDYTVVWEAGAQPPQAQLAVGAREVVLAEPALLATLLGRDLRPELDHEVRPLVPDGLFVATAVVGPAQRDLLQQEVQAARADPALLAVRDAALSLRVGARVDLTVVIRCRPDHPCQPVGEIVARLRRDVAVSPVTRALGLTDGAERAALATTTDRVTLSVGLSLEDSLEAIRRLTTLATGPRDSRAASP